MSWATNVESLMQLVKRAQADQALLANHIEGVLPKLVALHARNAELIAAFEIEDDQQEVAILRNEQARLEQGIAFYESAKLP